MMKRPSESLLNWFPDF